jgi:hypothetical protein
MGPNIPGPVLALTLILASAVIVIVSLALRALYLRMREDLVVPRGTSDE